MAIFLRWQGIAAMHLDAVNRERFPAQKKMRLPKEPLTELQDRDILPKVPG